MHVALFGPRGTGKTSFTLELRRELARDHEPDAPPWQMLRVDLRRAISLPAFIGAVRTALDRHPGGRLRRRAGDAWRRLEKDIGINLGVVAAGVRTTGRQALNEAEVLHDQLLALTQATDRLVVVFDEFQRLNSCPGEPLSIIRSSWSNSPRHTRSVPSTLPGRPGRRRKTDSASTATPSRRLSISCFQPARTAPTSRRSSMACSPERTATATKPRFSSWWQAAPRPAAEPRRHATASADPMPPSARWSAFVLAASSKARVRAGE
jgi:AAA ATPase-like protein